MPKAKKNKKGQFHTIAKEDLENNPSLVKHGVAEGDEVEPPMDDLLTPPAKEVVINGKVYIETTDAAGCTFRNLKE